MTVFWCNALNHSCAYRGEAILDFIKCLEHHAAVRLGRLNGEQYEPVGMDLDECTYWVCACKFALAFYFNDLTSLMNSDANNQWELAKDIDPDPLKSSFFLAMKQCRGIVIVLDPNATAYTRIWVITSCMHTPA